MSSVLRFRLRCVMASRQKRSAVWTFFSAPVEKKVECKHCRKKLVYTGGTTVMREHLKRAHPLLLDAADESKSTSKQNTLLQHIVSKPVPIITYKMRPYIHMLHIKEHTAKAK